ncbi:hypothetical protein FACS1894133_4930 [Clostridia bacterium]|nr:hypothetical protein FACS1894133_4930 [Clostridia bacterium]
MAIEKMSYVLVEGDVAAVDGVLERVCASGIFQITPPFAAGGDVGDASAATLVSTNAYSGLLQRTENLAETLGIDLAVPVSTAKDSKAEVHNTDASDDFGIQESTEAYISGIESRLTELIREQDTAATEKARHEAALRQVERMSGSADFAKLFRLEYTRIRFGRLPFESFQKLQYVDCSGFEFVEYEREGDFLWCAYVTTQEQAHGIDDIFKTLYFERVRLPDYLSGTPDEAQKQLAVMLADDTGNVDRINAAIDEIRDTSSVKLRVLAARLRILDECDELKSNISVTYAYGKSPSGDGDIVDGRFYLTGFVPQRELSRFGGIIEDGRRGGFSVSYSVIPISGGGKSKFSTPVKLRNNALFRPFEMFINMYGLPKYGTIDVTAFVAVTYMLIYGVMFGDLGQGIAIFGLGLFLSKVKKLPLGSIMTRIGLASAFFGFFYGSVFGREDIVTPFFERPEFIDFMHLANSPKSVFDISTPLLLGTLVLGAALILISMVINIVIGLKLNKIEEVCVSPSGIVGLIFYCAVLIGIGFSFVEVNVMSPLYIGLLIVLPLLALLFREKLKLWLEKQRDNRRRRRVRNDKILQDEIERYGGAIRADNNFSDGSVLNTNRELFSGRGGYTYENFLDSNFFEVRYGVLSYESYLTLRKYNGITRFFFFPFDTCDAKVSCFYIASKDTITEADNLFAGLGFERAKLPQTSKELIDNADLFKSGETAEEHSHGSQKLGGMLLEGVIELFECCLSYLTNTMSFLRVGGFVMSHAGLMLVVHTLARSAGGGAVVVEIIGNIFVIIVEGFLVGIQVLRLEFYEMFGRFYRSGGIAFKPVNINLK